MTYLYGVFKVFTFMNTSYLEIFNFEFYPTVLEELNRNRASHILQSKACFYLECCANALGIGGPDVTHADDE